MAGPLSDLLDFDQAAAPPQSRPSAPIVPSSDTGMVDFLSPQQETAPKIHSSNIRLLLVNAELNNISLMSQLREEILQGLVSQQNMIQYEKSKQRN